MSLHKAVRYGDICRVKDILKSGYESNRKDWRGDTSLHKASRHGYSTIAYELLLCGADTNIKNKKGATPLHLAAYYGYIFMVKLLLKYGASKDISDNDGNTPAMKAKERGHTIVYDFLNQNKRRCKSVKIVDKEDELRDAIRDDDVDRVRSLIEEGVIDLTKKNEIGWSLFKDLISRRSYLMVKLNDTNHLFRMTTDSKSIALLLSLKDPKTNKPYYIALNDDGFNKELII